MGNVLGFLSKNIRPQVNNPKSVWQGGSGKYYCKIGGQSKVCIQPGQPTGANCDPLPPTGEQGCSYGGMHGVVEQVAQNKVTKNSIMQYTNYMGGYGGNNRNVDQYTNGTGNMEYNFSNAINMYPGQIAQASFGRFRNFLGRTRRKKACCDECAKHKEEHRNCCGQ